MSQRDIRSLDIGMLRTFDALLRERNVSRAAARLFLSQPAVSASLNKLRQVFGDPLFTRTAHGVVPTARALALAPQVQKVLAELAALLEEYHDLLARHRLSIDTIHPTFPDHRTGRLDETAVEMALRKHLLHRHASTISLPIWSQWPFADPLGADREAAQLYAATWMKVVKKLRCEARGYVIHSDLDEPNSADDYAMVRRWGDFFNEAEHKHGVRLPLLITEQPTPDDPWWGRLDGSVDIWVPHISSVWQDMEAPDGKRDIERRVKAGDEVWCYAALVQMPDAWERAHCKPEVLRESNPPVWCLDFPAMNHRIPAWVMPLHGITGFCYWDTLHAEPGVDVWADAGNFLHPEAGSYNGDGSYIYPATRERHGRHMPVASVRLKWLREMTEDYDYLMLARDLGLCNEAQLLADTFARGFGDWEDRMDKLFEARRKLADLIVRKGGRSWKCSSSPPMPTRSSITAATSSAPSPARAARSSPPPPRTTRMCAPMSRRRADATNPSAWCAAG